MEGCNNENIINIKDTIRTINKVVQVLPEPKNSLKTIPVIFNKTFDENFISDYLAYILNPTENGVGIDPLIELLKKALDYNQFDYDELRNVSLKDIEITREKTFDNKRRIDILIEIKNLLIIGIENKIFSSEGEKQTIDYEKSLAEEFPGMIKCLFFLTPDGKNPLSKSFISISYKDLLYILRQVRYDFTKDIRRSILFNDFILHLEEYIVGNKVVNISDRSKIYLENYILMKELQESINNDWDQIFQYINSIMVSYYNSAEWLFNFSKDRNYHQILKKGWKTDGFEVHFEFSFDLERLLIDKKIAFMVHVEGSKNKDAFFNEFDKVYENNKNIYENNKIEYRPKKNSRSIAYKEYKMDLNIDCLDNSHLEKSFIHILGEFKYMESLIDKTLKKLNY